jgi:hypothetical protein
VDEFRLTWVQIPGTMLPVPQRLHRAPCMTDREGPQMVPPGSTCCWYHGGDWNLANRLLLNALSRVERERTSDRLVESLSNLLDHLTLDDWTHEALHTLILEPIDLDGNLKDYGNGQHRCQAMLDQRVKSVAATWYVFDDRKVRGVRRFKI